MKHREGQALIRGLAVKSDVLIENFVPGKLDGLGLGYDDLKEEAPGLIYCSVTGFGSDGPYREGAGDRAFFAKGCCVKIWSRLRKLYSGRYLPWRIGIRTYKVCRCIYTYSVSMYMYILAGLKSGL